MHSAAPVFVLVHSPLVGPSTWRPVAEELERRGRHALVPSLVGVASAPAPQWRYVCAAVEASTAQVTRAVVLAGHSGAGPLLPAIAGAIRCAVAATIYVDAVLPPAAGTATLQRDEFRDQLRGMARDGVLPPWSEWFGEDAMQDLVPDEQLRARLSREMPRLPLSYFEGEPPVTEGWDRGPCAYLLLSPEPYASAAADAEARGWPVRALPQAKHLHLVTHPQAVTDALLDLERELAGVSRARRSARGPAAE